MSEKLIVEQLLDGLVDRIANLAAARLETQLVNICRREWNEYVKIVDESYQPMRQRIINLESAVQDIQDRPPVESMGDNSEERREEIKDICADMIADEIRDLLSTLTRDVRITIKGH